MSMESVSNAECPRRERPGLDGASDWRDPDERLAQEVTARVVSRNLARSASGGRPLVEVVNDTLYHERTRLRLAHDERAEEDRVFHARLQRELPHASLERQGALVWEIVDRYVSEIRGHFDARVYKFATRVLPYGLSAIMQRFSPRAIVRELRGVSRLAEHLILEGEVDGVKRLASRGTVVLAPTHSSNLDSLLVGHSIFRMGLPPFAYGAGLNLFSNPLTSFFMRNLGAYTVDRRKTDPLYRETLKEYATVSIEFGQHNIFFPGGTRSRSGELESKLKLGLLGAGLAAYRNHALAGRDKRVFIVPCTITYPIVLEAASLVRDFLAETGKSEYILVEDESGVFLRWVDFLRGVAELDLRVHVRIGRGLDPFGNNVDPDGGSIDSRGRVVDPKRYLCRNGHVEIDAARDAEYTRALGDKLLLNYRRDNVVLGTHVVAFALLERLRQDLPSMDVYRLLRKIGADTCVEVAFLEREVAHVVGELHRLDRAGKIHLSDEIQTSDAQAVTLRGIRGLSSYHAPPVVERRGSGVVVLNPDLLFYYRNRLEGYGLSGSRLFSVRESK